MTATITIRTATAEDFPTMLAIDDDATLLYREHGIVIDLPGDHPFIVAEQARWSRAVANSSAFLAIRGEVLGFAAVGVVDGAGYLDQLSVRRDAQRRGIGGRLVERAISWAEREGHDSLWLTTYGQLPFNRAYYERHQFSVVPEPEWTPGIAHHVAEQRRWLPGPEHRVAMRRDLG